MTHILALDQGTTSSRAIVFDRSGKILAQARQEHRQIYPQPGWVEHDPEEIWSAQVAVARQSMHDAGALDSGATVIGIANQRETTIVWDKKTGAPIANAIVWQDRRTAAACDRLQSEGLTDTIRQKTGLVLDAYFSATKLAWLLENISGARARAENGDLLFGTVDTYLLWKLTAGRVHATDSSNASRTLLYNIHSGDWDDDLLAVFQVPRRMLPEVLPSSHVYGDVPGKMLGLGSDALVCAIAGDQQAATFGQACFSPGQVKNTYGTGCFMLMNTGEHPIASSNNLLTTIAWTIGDKVTYALEGSVFVAGAAIQYLRDELDLIERASESEALALSIENSGGVYFVPAFAGLGAPYWDQHARGAILGLTRGSGTAHIVRAALESVAYQSRDLANVMQADTGGLPLHIMRVDGGMVENDFLMQFQADILGVPIERPTVAETTALGAAYLAGLTAGYYTGFDQIQANWRLDKRFEPSISDDHRESLYSGWQRAVERVRTS